MRDLTPLSDLEKRIVATMSRATFPPATASKRFVRDLANGHIRALSPRGRRFLAYVAHRFRRQYALDAEQQQWVNEWISERGDAGALQLLLWT